MLIWAPVRQTLSGMVLLGSVLRCSEGTEEALPFPRGLYGYWQEIFQELLSGKGPSLEIRDEFEVVLGARRKA